jgi:hypothetical protein
MVMTVENLHVLEEEFLDVEEEILDVMEAENLHVIEEERLVPVSVPRKCSTIGSCTAKSIGVLRSVRWSWRIAR